MCRLRCASVVLLVLLQYGSTRALEVDASKFGFTFKLPTEWKVVGNPNPYRQALFAIQKDGQARIAVLLMTDYVLPRSDFHYSILNGVPPRGSKFKITESSVFRTASNNTALFTNLDVTTKDGQRLRQSLYSFEIRAWTYLCVSFTGPMDGRFDQTIESIIKTFRLIR
jgi:hypothetical protein